MYNDFHKKIVETLFNDIKQLSFDGVGITRDSYGIGETRTAEYLICFARQHGLKVKIDDAANLIFSIEEELHIPSVWMGSHIDSVPEGGNFDGLAGVIAGLMILIMHKDKEIALPFPLKVIAFRGEESAWFGKAYIGSSALFGKLSDQDFQLQHRTTKQTLAECMKNSGANLVKLREQNQLIDPKNVLSYFELHIEQGPVLLKKQLPIGIVTGIRGNFRHNSIECFGDAQHSGAVPRELRHDAVFAVSELITLLDQQWELFLQEGKDLVITSGIMHTDTNEHSISRIPGHVQFSFEARSLHQETLNEFYQVFIDNVKYVQEKRLVKFKLDQKLNTAPARMDKNLIKSIGETCSTQGIPTITLASGAGHDASIFANNGIPSSMIFIRNEFGSHNPHEQMDIDDFMVGLNILSKAIAA